MPRASRTLFYAILICVTPACAFVANAQVYALGASNTVGKGLSSFSDAWPAQLEQMLRARGFNVSVTVNAINGQTSSQIADRASAIPAGTKAVVFDTGGDNDRLAGSMSSIPANRARIISAVKAKGAVPIQAPYVQVAGPQHRQGNPNYQADEIHLTADAHRRVAAAVLSRVIAALKSK